MMIATLFALALAWAPQETEQMRVRPSSEADAVADFERTCVAGLTNPDVLRRAAAASPRGYVRQAGDDSAISWRNWTSPYGTLHYLQGGPETSTAFVPECNFTSFTRAAVNRRALYGALEALAVRNARSGLAESEQGGHRAWSWLGAAREPRMVIAVLDRKTPNQITLSLRLMAVGTR